MDFLEAQTRFHHEICAFELGGLRRDVVSKAGLVGFPDRTD
jgi:hypothetical protein